MRIAWVSSGKLSGAGDALTSVSASSRYRMLIPARELRALGHEIALIDSTRPLRDAERAAVQRADAVIVGKLLRNADGSFAESARRCREILAAVERKDERLVLDVNDDNFSVPVFRRFYEEAGSALRTWVCSTDEMLAALRRHASGPMRVIADPYEGPAGEPKAPRARASFLRGLLRRAQSAAARPGLRLLWFGHFSNAASFASVIPQARRAAGRVRAELVCVSAPGWGLEKICKEADAPAEGFALRFVVWSTATLWRELREADLVLLPSSLSPTSEAKSANRLVETVRAGRFAVAHPVPSYLALRDCAWIGDDLGKGIGWALAHPRQALERIRAGQAHVERHFSPAVIARAWSDVLEGSRLENRPACTP